MTKVVHLAPVHQVLDMRVFQKECKTLAKAGYEVVMVTSYGNNETIDGVRIHTVHKPKNKVIRILSNMWRVFRAARKEDAPIYHLHSPELIPVGFVLSLLGKKIIYDMHEYVPGYLLTKEWIPPWLRKPISTIVAGLERLTLNRFYVFFAEKSYAEEYPWVKHGVTVLNYPILDFLLQIKAEKYPEPTIGYVGDVNESRGALVTTEALVILAKKGKAPKWLCIGNIQDALKTRLLSIIKEYHLEVEFTGYMVTQQAHPLVAKTHIGLAVVDRIPNNTGSLLTKLFEYMALGMPLITSDFPLYKELVEGIGCGLCVAPEKPEELADAIEYLLVHPEEAIEMGRRGRAAAIANYNWESEAKKMLQVYQSLLGHTS
jgi:glycosyltransferase involved in cell wall biosynthesis